MEQHYTNYFQKIMDEQSVEMSQILQIKVHCGVLDGLAKLEDGNDSIDLR